MMKHDDEMRIAAIRHEVFILGDTISITIDIYKPISAINFLPQQYVILRKISRP